MEITLYGDVPSKKNSKQIIYVRGKPIIISSKQYLKWEKEQSIYLKSIAKGQNLANLEGLTVSMRFYSETVRKSDLDNKSASILDLLKLNSIIKDDNWFVVKKIILEYMGKDKEKPRVIVNLSI